MRRGLVHDYLIITGECIKAFKDLAAYPNRSIDLFNIYYLHHVINAFRTPTHGNPHPQSCLIERLSPNLSLKL